MELNWQRIQSSTERLGGVSPQPNQQKIQLVLIQELGI